MTRYHNQKVRPGDFARFILLGSLALASACTPTSPLTTPADSVTPRVTGIGGVFFKSPDPKALYQWYETNLGLTFSPTLGEGHVNFCWRDAVTGEMARTVWGPFHEDTRYFDPGTRDVMMNYRVVNLDGLLEMLRRKGVTVLDEIEEYDYGRFAWIIDIDENKIELWEPSEAGYPWHEVCNLGGN